ncbi:MAG TPA: TRAP transporter substrate-binding protein DctP [bacterium]|nr:TRAP transporter substrate-binding protein DctP [bacterium]
MRLVRSFAVFCALALAALLMGGGPLPAPFSGAQPVLAATTLKAQFFLPKGHPLSKHLEQIYADIEKATNGEVKIQSFYASELVPLRQALDGLSNGTLDILVGPGNYYSGKIALGDISIMPLNFKHYTDRARAFYNEGIGKILNKVYSKHGIEVVAPYNYFTGEVVIVRKGVSVNSLADLKGLKLRVAGGELVQLVKALGAEPVFIAPPELYTGLQRGTVDGAIFPSNDLVLLKLHEVSSTVLLPDYIFSGPMMHFFMFNKAAFDGLSAANRQAIEKVLHQAALQDDRNSEGQLVAPFQAKAEAAGVKYVTLSAADIAASKAATDAARNAYIKYNTEQGNGAEAHQILNILDRLTAR